MRDKVGYVYVMANDRNGTLYVGVTSDLVRRVWQHKSRQVEGFTCRYNIKSLVYYECFEDMPNAIIREKILKRWRRSWKTSLIANANPDWRDLYDDILGNVLPATASSWTPHQVRGDATGEFIGPHTHTLRHPALDAGSIQQTNYVEAAGGGKEKP